MLAHHGRTVEASTLLAYVHVLFSLVPAAVNAPTLRTPPEGPIFLRTEHIAFVSDPFDPRKVYSVLPP